MVLGSLSRGAARCLSEVIYRGARAVAYGATRRASQVLGRGVHTVVRGAATLSQQKKSNLEDV